MRPRTWGFVAECIRLSTSGSRTTPIAAIMASNAPSEAQHRNDVRHLSSS